MAAVVVTGGGGFVGRALALALRSQGHEVVSLSRTHYADLESAGIQSRVVDLASSTSELVPHLQGVEAVFHVAAKVDMWGLYEDFFRTNVKGTRNLLQACWRNGVTKFIYTSSPSVIADGQDRRGVDESCTYPSRYDAFYPATKAIAEREVLGANGTRDLRTISLRPHLIWGPGDRHLVPTILNKARAGKLVQIGDGSNLTDLSYIEDCVAAHLAAYAALDSNPACAGRPYFISQGEPVSLWQWINDLLLRNGIKPIKKSIPVGAARALALLLEIGARLDPLRRAPRLTRFLVSEMATSHYFDIGAARRELGYNPRYSIAEAMDKTFGTLPQSVG